MGALLSRESGYALRALLYLAALPKPEHVTMRTLSEALRIPYHYLAKIMQTLSRKGLLESKKGPQGGFLLRPGVRKMNVHDVLAKIGDTHYQTVCILGQENCSALYQCRLHDRWSNLVRRIDTAVFKKTLDSLAREHHRSSFSSRAHSSSKPTHHSGTNV